MSNQIPFAENLLAYIEQRGAETDPSKKVAFKHDEGHWMRAETNIYTWELKGKHARIITDCWYKSVEAAVRAAKRMAKQLGVEIVRGEYCEIDTRYKQPLRV